MRKTPPPGWRLTTSCTAHFTSTAGPSRSTVSVLMTPSIAYVAGTFAERDVAERPQLVEQEVAHVAAQGRAGLVLRIADRFDVERRLADGAPPDAGLAGRQGRRIIHGRAELAERVTRHVAHDGRRIVERRRRRLARSGRRDEAQRADRAGAHRRLRISQRRDQRRDRTLLPQPSEDQRRVDANLVRGVVEQRVLDVVDPRRGARRCGDR